MIAVPVSLNLHTAELASPSNQGHHLCFVLCACSAELLSLFSTIRLMAALEQHRTGCLDAVESLLGCPLVLFEMVGAMLASPRGHELLLLCHASCVLETRSKPGCAPLAAPSPRHVDAMCMQGMADPQQFGRLPGEQRRCVLLGLWYALNWCRELANCYSHLISS